MRTLLVSSLTFLFLLGSATLVVPAVGQQTPPTQAPAPAPVKKSAGIVVTVDGKQVMFGDEQPQIIAGRTLVPMRAIFEALGATVDYNLEFKKITARRDGTEIELTISEKIARKNGAEITLEIAPTLRGGSTLVPLRFVAEALDTNVNYDPKAMTIAITSKEDNR